LSRRFAAPHAGRAGTPEPPPSRDGLRSDEPSRTTGRFVQPDPLTRRQLLAASTAVIAAAAAGVAAAAARLAGKSDDARKALFESAKIPSLAIEIANDDMQSLRQDSRKYVKSQVKEDGGKATYTDVAIRTKGSAGSKRSIDEKAAFTLNLDKFEDAQLFHGMDKFHLNNCAQDPSYVSELIVGEMYRAAGVPAARVTHAVVKLNDRKPTFYALKEGYDKGFLKLHFGSNNGNFYDGGFLRDIDATLDLGSGGKDGPKDQAELKSLVEVSREQDKDRRFGRMERRMDMDKFISYLSLQMLTWDWDGYPMQRNNYRIYHEPKTNKLTWIPSGMDQMWGDPNGPLFPNYNGMIARHLIETPRVRKRYLARTRELLKDVFVPDRWSARLDELLARVQPALKAVDEGAARDLPNHFKRLKDGIKQRAKKIGGRVGEDEAVIRRWADPRVAAVPVRPLCHPERSEGPRAGKTVGASSSTFGTPAGRPTGPSSPRSFAALRMTFGKRSGKTSRLGC
jgi:spore coat protein CotH